MITDAQFRLWLKQDNKAQRVWTAHLNYQDEEGGEPITRTLRISTQAYRRGAGRYYAILLSVPEFTRELGGERRGVYASSYGVANIDARGGQFNWLLDAAIDGSTIEFRLGDVDWSIDDHRLIFAAKMVVLQRANKDTFQLQIQDIALRLNQSISGDTLVGGTGPNADKPRPFNFGLVRQVEFFLVDRGASPGPLYAHSDTGENCVAIETFDRFAPVDFVDNGDGTVNLLADPFGKVTGTIVATRPDGDPSDPTLRKVSDMIDTVVGLRAGLIAEGAYAGPHPTFVVGDDEDYPIGVNVPDTRNAFDFLADASASGQFSFANTRLQQFTYLRIRPNDVATLPMTPFDIKADDVMATGPATDPEVSNDPPKYYRIRALANLNWTSADDVTPGLDPDDRTVRTREGLPVEQDDAVGDTYADRPELYNLTLVPSPTLKTWVSMDTDDDATALMKGVWLEVERYNGLPILRTVTMTVGLHFFEKELGDVGRITFPFFNLEAGVLGQVVRIRLRPTDYCIDISLFFRSLSQPYPEGWERVTTSDEAITVTSFDFDATTGPPVAPPPGPPLPPGLPPVIGVGGGGGITGVGGGGLSWWGDPPDVPSIPSYTHMIGFEGQVQGFGDWNVSVAMNSTGDLAAVGKFNKIGSPGASVTGWIDVYSRSGSAWSWVTQLDNSADANTAMLGWVVGIADDGTIATAERQGGRIHVFTQTSPTTWSHALIRNVFTSAAGSALALARDAGDVIVYLRSAGDDFFEVWKKVSGTWSLQQTITITPNTVYNVAISGDGNLIAVSCGASSNLTVRVYQADMGRTTWSMTNNITPTSESGNTHLLAGQMIAISNDKSLIAATAPDDQTFPTNWGTMFLLKSTDGGATFSQSAYLRAEVGRHNYQCGGAAIIDDATRIFFGDAYQGPSPGFYQFGGAFFANSPKFMTGPHYLVDDGYAIANPYTATTDHQRFGEAIATSADGAYIVIASGNTNYTSGRNSVDFYHYTP